MPEQGVPYTASSEKTDIDITIPTDPKLPIDSSDSDSHFTDGNEEVSGDYGSYRDHIFANPEVAKYWTDVMHKAKYEGRHRFDPDFTWSATEEKKLRRKVDYQRRNTLLC